MDEPWKHESEGKKPDPKGHVWSDTHILDLGTGAEKFLSLSCFHFFILKTGLF